MIIEQARPGSLEPVQDASITWRYIAPRGHTLETVTHPEYWRHNARECDRSRLVGKHAWNKIEIIAEDGTWEADLRVVSVANGIVETRVLRVWREQRAKDEAPVPEGYTVEYVQDNGWRAMDRKGNLLAEKRSTRDLAVAAAVEHQRAAKGGK